MIAVRVFCHWGICPVGGLTGQVVLADDFQQVPHQHITVFSCGDEVRSVIGELGKEKEKRHDDGYIVTYICIKDYRVKHCQLKVVKWTEINAVCFIRDTL